MQYTEIVKQGADERIRTFVGTFDEIADLLAELYAQDQNMIDDQKTNDKWDWRI